MLHVRGDVLFSRGYKKYLFCTLCLLIVVVFSFICYIFLVYMSGVHRIVVTNGVQTDLFWAKSGLFGPKLGRRQVSRLLTCLELGQVLRTHADLVEG